MIIGYGSDFHTEIKGQSPLELHQDVDVLILAGDIGSGIDGLQFALDHLKARCKHLIYVLGNHEHYQFLYEAVVKANKDLATTVPNVHVLERDTVIIDGITFIGATLWTDFELPPHSQQINMAVGTQSLFDYRCVWVTEGNAPGIITAEWMLNQNQLSKQYIFDELEKHGRENCIVITHHGPAMASVHPKYITSNINASFNSPWDELVAEKGPRIWVHGHVHDPFDYTLGQTRVLVNPRGYPNERGDEYEFGIVDVSLVAHKVASCSVNETKQED